MRNSTRRKYKVTSPVRFFIFILITVMILTFSICTIISDPIEAASAVCTYKQITVRENDTLWSIAEEFGPSSMDTRIIVQEICDANDITPDQISSGDTIFVPVEINR